MSDQDDAQRLEEERRIAHSGGLARVAGHCARHPWRVVFTWLGIFFALIGLNVAFHGTLVNEFKVPGTDIQKATDLINAKFGGQKGAALRVVVAAPPGERLDTPERQAAIAQDARGRPGRRRNRSTRTRRTSTHDHRPARQGLASALEDRPDRVLRRPVRPTGFELPRPDIVKVEDSLRAIGEPAGVQVEFTGDAESAPPTQG